MVYLWLKYKFTGLQNWWYNDYVENKYSFLTLVDPDMWYEALAPVMGQLKKLVEFLEMYCDIRGQSCVCDDALGVILEYAFQEELDSVLRIL